VSRVHFVVPSGIDDVLRPSGGNTYDRRVMADLTSLGWELRAYPVNGSWPNPDAAALAALDSVLAEIPPNELAVIDGLIASAAPDVIGVHAMRLQLVALMHMAIGDPAECAAVSTVRGVIATSEWLRHRLIELYSLAPEKVQVASPGVDAAVPSSGSIGGTELLCVGAVAPHKGHDLLIAALAGVADRAWHCVCAGSLDVDRGFADRVRRDAAALGGRVDFAGPLTGAALDRAYATADVLVVASRSESYGMVVTEALAHGLPVIAAAVGGVPEALGCTAGGLRPGLLIEPGDPIALAEALRRWLDDAPLRTVLRRVAQERRPELLDWAATSRRVAAILSQHESLA
jgi:glycosyltransferase involved in cell wall biosynthesis